MAADLGGFTRVPSEPVLVPTDIGHWIKREPLPDGDSIVTIDRDEDGRLCHFFFPYRPIEDFDRGEWYGPLRLVPAAPSAGAEP